MKTKIWKICLSLLLAVSLTACVNVNDAEQKEVKEVITSYYDLLHDGKAFSASEKYTSKEFYKKNEILKYKEDLKNDIMALNLDATFNTEAEKYMQHVFGRMFESYTVESVEIEGNQAKARVTFEGILPEELEERKDEIDAKMSALFDRYMLENEGRLTAMMLNDEEKATQTIFAELAPAMFTCYRDFVDGMDSHESTVRLYLEKDKDGWKIVEMK